MSQLTIVLIILALTIAAFISGKLPYTVIAIGIIAALILTGVMSVTEAFSALTNENVIMLAAMFVISAGIVKSGLLEKIKQVVNRYSDRPKYVVLILMLVATALSILSSAVGTMAILLPLIVTIASDLKISRSKLIFPIAAVANISTACTFLGQGSANMTWSDVMVKIGGKIPFTIWDFTIARIPVIIVAIVYGIFIAPKLLPDLPDSAFDSSISYSSGKENTVEPEAARRAAVISVASIIAMLVLDYFGIVPMYLSACIGAALLIASGVLTEKEALSSVHGPTMFLFIGVLPLSDALKMTGAADVIAEQLQMLLGNATNPYVIMAVFFIVPLFLTQIMSNIAAAAIFAPLVSSVAVAIGIDPRAAVMGVAIASCTSILTPMSCACQAMIMAPGGYTLKDYLKCGLPLAILITILCTIYLPMMFPFYY